MIWQDVYPFRSALPYGFADDVFCLCFRSAMRVVVLVWQTPTPDSEYMQQRQLGILLGVVSLSFLLILNLLSEYIYFDQVRLLTFPFC